MNRVQAVILNLAAATMLATPLWAQTGAPSAQPSAAQAPAAGQAQPPQTGGPGVIVVEEDVVLPLIDTPEQHFHAAQRYFARGDQRDAASQVRAGAALLELEAGRHDAANKDGLTKAADRLNSLATQLAKGKVKSAKELRAAFAQADLALARHYHRMAQQSLEQNDQKHTGYWLEGASNSISDAAAWSGQKLKAGTRSTLNGAQTLGRKLQTGAGWTVDKVKQGITGLGHELDSLGSSGGSSSN